ncbi:flavin reductase family protein [Microbacterium rhizomatis]|uniref:Flavin reductase family protein n=1 Tax=Microbacterium rhizomatis TaxID=1631477 RepID=A0A5J5J2U4_9MICO|nr:flavin reductase family protein [Microbacterium rhizomatis]KAA9107723.1 flavin reductase family protein [Microbacterium rhizomatis]
MDYTPETGHGFPHDPFKSLTVPRPIGWISTRSTAGVDNLAPFSHFQNVMGRPPMVMFAATQSPLGGRKDTVRNAEETGWFVWNMATWDLRDAVNRSSVAAPWGVDEFTLAGLTKAPSIESAVSRVAESPCHFECRYLQTIRLPGGGVDAVDMVIGQVTRVHIADHVIQADGKVDIPLIKPLARLGYYDYAVVESVFEMKPPPAYAHDTLGVVGMDF